MTMTLKDRQVRYDFIVQSRDAGMTLEAIGESLGLTKERVRQLLKHPPQKNGRPPKPRD